MKIIKYLFFTILISSFLAFTNQTWKEFKSFEGKFRILTPGNMTEKVQKISTAIGEIAYHQFIYKPEDKNPDNVFYLVNYCDYPKGTFHPDSTALIADFLNETIASSAHSVFGKISYSADIQLQTHKGKIWRVQYNDDRALIKSKCFLVGDRFYMLQTMMVKEKSMNPSADKFLDSFYVF